MAELKFGPAYCNGSAYQLMSRRSRATATALRARNAPPTPSRCGRRLGPRRSEAADAGAGPCASIRTISRVCRTCRGPPPCPCPGRGVRASAGGNRHVEDRAAPEPQRRAHHAGKAEHIGPRQERVEADQPAHRRARDARVLGVRGGVRNSPIDERLERVGEEREVRVAVAAAEARVAEGAVFARSARRPCSARRRRWPRRPRGAIRSIVSSTPHSPANDVACVEQVLAVVHVDDGVVPAALRRRTAAGRRACRAWLPSCGLCT